MRMFHTVRLALAASALTLVGSALAGPTGDLYQFSGTNFPDTYGPVTLTYDGVAQTAGGMSVNERFDDFAGIPGGILTNFGLLASYENAGEVLEWSFRTLDNQLFSDAPTTPWGFAIEDLSWPSLPGVPVQTVESTSYLYFTTNGTPRTLNPALATSLGVVVGPHPFDASVPQVIYITSQDSELFSDGIASVVLEPEDSEDFPAALLQQLFGTSGGPLNGVQAGIMFQHVPEPSTIVLAAGGLMALALVSLRRRAK